MAGVRRSPSMFVVGSVFTVLFILIASPFIQDRRKVSLKLNKDRQTESRDLVFAQRVSNASTFIFRSLRLCVGILLCKDRGI